MMALVMGARSPAALARASELGIAMQLSNIARDVGEDARRGRIYLPLDWIAEAGLDADALVRDPQPSAALASIVARVIDEAEQVYARAARGLGYLPPQCRPAIQIALRLYREIGRQVRRNGLDAVTRRAVVSPARKLAALGVSVGDLAFAGRRLGAPAPFAAGFLVDAVLRSPSPRAPQGGARWRPAVPVAEARGMDVPWWNISARVALMLELFMRLEQRGLN
jgi:phytoene synthase